MNKSKSVGAINQEFAIERIALATMFSEDNIDAILQIAKATGKTDVAIRILLGLYEEPELVAVIDDSKDGSEVNRKFESFDPFKNEVKYSFIQVGWDTCWFPKGYAGEEKKDLASHVGDHMYYVKSSLHCEDDKELKEKYYSVRLNERRSKTRHTRTMDTRNWQDF